MGEYIISLPLLFIRWSYSYIFIRLSFSRIYQIHPLTNHRSCSVENYRIDMCASFSRCLPLDVVSVAPRLSRMSPHRAPLPTTLDIVHNSD